jgi:hypothetical protein
MSIPNKNPLILIVNLDESDKKKVELKSFLANKS